MQPIQGLHHITAITRDAQQNVDFFRNTLGQRLVKKTVNFDAPDSYHFYYADASGTPGSVMTFFAWPGVRRAIRGNGSATAVAYNVPAGSLGFWQERLRQMGISLSPIEKRFGAEVLPFDSPDGMRLELIENSPQAEVQHWEAGPVDPRFALQGFHSTSLWLDQVVPTSEVLTRQMGYSFAGQEDNRYRFTGGSSALGSVVDLVHRPEGNAAALGAGAIHHVAFRVADDETQLAYLESLQVAGLGVSPVRDRSYFHSIYYNEPGGVLFEIATANPGFGIDEPAKTLGEELKLPQWLEEHRPEIEKALEPIALKPVQREVYDLQK